MTRVLRSRTLRTVIVTFKQGASFRGVLFAHDREALVLRNAEHLPPGSDRVSPVSPVDGELVVLLADVLYMQFP